VRDLAKIRRLLKKKRAHQPILKRIWMLQSEANELVAGRTSRPYISPAFCCGAVPLWPRDKTTRFLRIKHASIDPTNRPVAGLYIGTVVLRHSQQAQMDQL